MDERTYGEAPDDERAGRRRWLVAARRGAARRCPNCGEGRLLDGLLTVRSSCDVCGLDYSGHRADDLPPYLTIIIVAKLIVPLILVVERFAAPSALFSTILWCFVATALCVALLPRVKGGVIGLQWALRMHGFGEGDGWAERPAEREAADRPGSPPDRA